jgi:peptide/nickel transport system ATP-binding protein
MTEGEPLLQVEELEKYFDQRKSLLNTLLLRKPSKIQAVDGVTFDLHLNEVKGVIGESGCGKTTLLNTLLGLEKKTGGSILYKGEPVSEFSKGDWKSFRRDVQVIFQDPFDSLDPKKTVRQTLKLALDVHDMDEKERRITEVLEKVELRPPDRYKDRYPEQLSGGEKQRVAIARALVLEPEIIMADEPVSMLDVSTQARILKLLGNIIEEDDIAMIYISHDLSTVSYVCDEINVMYLGRIIERGPTMDVLNDPKHPYTSELMKAIPNINPDVDRARTRLKGSTPDPINIGEGCRFRDRCPERMDICEVTPEFVDIGQGRRTACHLHYDHETKEDETLTQN